MDTMQKLTELRKKRGLTQKDVARAMGVGQPAVSELERGNTASKIDTLQRYAAAVGATVEISVREVHDVSEGVDHD